MRFMMLFKPDKDPEPGISPCKQQLPEMAKLMGELKAAGVLLATEGLLPSDRGARVRYSDGKFGVIDGPFAEAKEVVAGFAIVCLNSKAEAIALAERFLTVAGGGESDILEIMEVPDTLH